MYLITAVALSYIRLQSIFLYWKYLLEDNNFFLQLENIKNLNQLDIPQVHNVVFEGSASY